jgi:hypothetical protein
MSAIIVTHCRQRVKSSNGDEALSDESLLKSNGDEA